MVAIRELKRKDREKIRAILQRTEMFRPDEVDVAIELIDIYLQDPNQRDYQLWVAESSEGEIAGYVCIGPTPLTIGTYDLYWIAVSPDFQRRGIGRMLLSHAEMQVARQSGRLIIIETSSLPKYADTQAFYLHAGYQLEARIKDFYQPGDDRLIFTKTITMHR
jgi:ribosomal protein S18 acetylase RimI-like enzyme